MYANSHKNQKYLSAPERLVFEKFEGPPDSLDCGPNEGPMTYREAPDDEMPVEDLFAHAKAALHTAEDIDRAGKISKIINQICDTLKIEWSKVHDNSIKELTNCVIRGYDQFDSAGFNGENYWVSLSDKTDNNNVFFIRFADEKAPAVSPPPAEVPAVAELSQPTATPSSDPYSDELPENVMTDLKQKFAEMTPKIQELAQRWQGRYDELTPDGKLQMYQQLRDFTEQMIPENLDHADALAVMLGGMEGLLDAFTQFDGMSPDQAQEFIHTIALPAVLNELEEWQEVDPEDEKLQIRIAKRMLDIQETQKKWEERNNTVSSAETTPSASPGWNSEDRPEMSDDEEGEEM